MEGPGFGVGADVAILHRRHLARRARMHHPLRVTVEERQVERLIDQERWLVGRPIRDKRRWVESEVVRPGALSSIGFLGGREGKDRNICYDEEMNVSLIMKEK